MNLLNKTPKRKSVWMTFGITIKKLSSIVITVGILNLLIFEKVSAQVVINEISLWDATGNWIEIYVFEDTDMSGWVIRDTADTPIKLLPEGAVYGPSTSKYLVVEAGNRLNINGDIIKILKRDDLSLVDQIPYGDKGGVCAPLQGQSIGRYPDANPTIERFLTQSKGQSNDTSVLAPCPAPTVETTNTPIPTQTSVPTKTPTPKPTQNEDRNLQILGTDEKVDEVKESEDVENTDSKNDKKSFPLMAGAFILAGISLISFPVINYLRLKRGYNKKR